MPAGGWGKKAASRYDKRLEDDELFKEIGGQLDSNFDYSQWQRTGGKGPDVKPKELKPKATVEDGPVPARVPDRAPPPYIVSGGAGSWGQERRVRSANDPACHHGRKKDRKQTISAAYDEAMAKKKAEQFRILQLRIRARKQTLAEYRKREAELLLANMELREEIMGEEKSAHDGVKKILRRYEKLRGGISTIADKFTYDLDDAKAELELTRAKTTVEIDSLQQKVDTMDELLKAQQSELHILMNYKDKEYPVKALKISELKTEINELEAQQGEEHGELQHIVDTEIDKFRREELRVKTEITQKATEEAITTMHPSLKDMALQNLVMAKEIEFHTREIASLEDQNEALSAEVKGLLRDPKTSVRQQMFPEFYPNREKCTPDMEVILDIPTQEWLPI